MSVWLAFAVLSAGAAQPIHAEGLCLSSFTHWVKASEAAYRTQARGDTREACLPSEETRRSLERALTVVRRACDLPGAAAEVATTRPMIEINAQVLATAPACADVWKAAIAETNASREQSWAAKTAVTVALPTPHLPVSATIRNPDPNSCLTLSQSGKVYSIENSRCPNARVIAVVEIKLSTGVLKCRGHVVTSQTKLGTAPPTVNYECRENGADCTTKSVQGIFPYCSW